MRAPAPSVAWLFALLALTLNGTPLAAGPTSEPQALSARDLYAAAQTLFDKGRYAEALVAFRQAHNASGSPNARLMIGHCLIALGRPGDAYDEMAATLEEATRRVQAEPRYAATRDSAAQQLAQLEPLMAKLLVEVPADAVEVTVNETKVERARLSAPRLVRPGVVVVAAVSADGRRASSTLEVKAGETQRVALAFPAELPRAASPGPAPAVFSAPAPAPVASSSGGLRTAGFVVAGVGVASLGAFAVTGLMARSRLDTLVSGCGGGRCTDPAFVDVVDSGKLLQTAANVGLGVGALALLGGGLMVLLGGPAATPRPTASVVLGPDRAVFFVSGSF
jgi:hypothetical protein